MQRYVRIITASAALCLALVFTGAKCTEHESLRQDADGSWTLSGEFHNTSDVWASGIELSGKLLDADGNVIATSDTSSSCPDVLSPQGFAAFNLHFPATPGKEPVSWVVGTSAGKAHDEPLPALEWTMVSSAVTRSGGALHVTGKVRNDSDRTYDFYPAVCVGLYDKGGALVAHVELVSFAGFEGIGGDPIEPGDSMEIDARSAGNAYPSAATARFWIEDLAPEAHDEEAFDVVMTDLMPIQ